MRSQELGIELHSNTWFYCPHIRTDVRSAICLFGCAGFAVVRHASLIRVVHLLLQMLWKRESYIAQELFKSNALELKWLRM